MIHCNTSLLDESINRITKMKREFLKGKIEFWLVASSDLRTWISTWRCGGLGATLMNDIPCMTHRVLYNTCFRGQASLSKRCALLPASRVNLTRL